MAAGAAAMDVDLQAVENIPRDTLVALLKRKDKESKAHAAKLEKLEERYVKVVRFNKILMEDRTSFQSFCHEFLPESDGVFEEAAAQETPTNLAELQRQLRAWKGAAEAAGEDRKVFQQFVELVFPGQDAALQLFNRPALGSDAFDVLLQRWMVLEDLQNQSIASINVMAREQVLAHSQEFQAAINSRQDSERRTQDLQDQLTKMAREKAQMLTQRLHGGGGQGTGSAEAPSVASSSSAADQAELRELREQRAAADRRERESREVAERHEQVLQASIDEQRAKVRRLKRELDRLSDESEHRDTQARKLVDEKDGVMGKLQQRAMELEQELSSNDFITRLAEQQAGREGEMRAQQRQATQMQQTLVEIQRLLGMSYQQEKVLKERIRELEQSQGRGHVAGDYLKHVVLKYIEYCQTGDLKSQSLIPVLSTLLNLSQSERKVVEQTSLPQGLLVLNQAVGGATSWLRGGTSTSAPTNEPPPYLNGLA